MVIENLCPKKTKKNVNIFLKNQQKKLKTKQGKELGPCVIMAFNYALFSFHFNNCIIFRLLENFTFSPKAFHTFQSVKPFCSTLYVVLAASADGMLEDAAVCLCCLAHRLGLSQPC